MAFGLYRATWGSRTSLREDLLVPDPDHLNTCIIQALPSLNPKPYIGILCGSASYEDLTLESKSRLQCSGAKGVQRMTSNFDRQLEGEFLASKSHMQMGMIPIKDEEAGFS